MIIRTSHSGQELGAAREECDVQGTTPLTTVQITVTKRKEKG